MVLTLSDLSGKDDFDFAVDLYNNNDYYRAISEFTRYLYYNPGSKRADDASLYIARSYYRAGQYRTLLQEVPELKKKVQKQHIIEEIDLVMARNYLYLGDYSFSSKIFNTLKKTGQNNKIKEKAAYDLVWVSIFKNDWNDATMRLNEFTAQYENSEFLDEARLLKTDLQAGKDFTSLSPPLAGLLSTLLPGMGQIYTKRIGDGLVALGFISLLTYGVYYYDKNGPEGMFYGFAVLDIVFYLGNIYTAVNSAQKYNRNFNDQLKQTIIDHYSY